VGGLVPLPLPPAGHAAAVPGARRFTLHYSLQPCSPHVTVFMTFQQLHKRLAGQSVLPDSLCHCQRDPYCKLQSETTAADKRSSLNPNLCGGAGDCAALAEDAARAAAGGRRAAARLLLLPGSQEEAGALTDPAFTHRAGQSLRTEQQEQQPGSGMHTSHINIHERCSPKTKCKCFEKLYCIACAPVAHRVLR